ncbi:hypothetical protein HPB52_023002 [Rhipicephalus sanguineus]|uniref:HTH psq-type domain-containing protein n=1 Tax=Rhipicephalus sanguineus TaxID=34632 RepID=A0A9D4T2V7_RHISA|nr:hypothetical protein HPB52_023002 [Rhipicephalus sanguineus]
MLGEKLRIIEEAEQRNGATKASIARDLNNPESSLKTILAKKDSILLNAAKFGLNRKAAKDGKYAAMEKDLVEWLLCSEVSLDDIIETVRPDTAGTSDEEEMDDAAEASVSVPTYADVLCYVDHIRRRRPACHTVAPANKALVKASAATVCCVRLVCVVLSRVCGARASEKHFYNEDIREDECVIEEVAARKSEAEGRRFTSII